ncbi:MAG: hypothetical protein K2H29_10105 [Oscillospiraceae bacterium]|nr:hypothetical protein [Oscillospiraceae bacterium]
MRLMMTKEMLKLSNEIKPYLDFSREDHLRPDTPDEIKQKRKRLHELEEKQWEEAMKIEMGLV